MADIFPGRPPGAGKSSFDLLEARKFFAELRLQAGGTLLDLGCGRGFYSLAAAPAIGPEGLISAVDLWAEGIEFLKKAAAALGYRQIRALVADAGRRLPLENANVDICLMATVLHDLVEAQTAAGTLREVARVVKPGGTLAIVEFIKIAGPPGPPLHIRLAPEDVERLVEPYGFHRIKLADVGPFTYLITFKKFRPRLED